MVRKGRKRKLPGPTTQRKNGAQFPNSVWCYDVSVGEYTRQGFEVTVGRSLTAGDLIGVLEKHFLEHGRPVCLRSDNGPERVSSAVQKWLKGRHVDTRDVDPGSPWQDSYCESFNSVFRTTCLDRCLFSSMTEARVMTNQCLVKYNTISPHGSLGGMNPKVFFTAMDRRQYQSTTGNLNIVTGPKVSGLSQAVLNRQETDGYHRCSRKPL